MSGRHAACLALGILLRAVPALAGVPCLLDDTGHPLRWQSMPVVFNPDPTQIGRLAFAAAQWSNGTSEVQLVEGQPLPEPITVSNYKTYLRRCGDGLNPVVIDGDGRILDAMLGKGARAAVGGVTQLDCEDDSHRPVLREFTVVLNGLFLSGGVAAHELGHVLNLCRSQLNESAADAQA